MSSDDSKIKRGQTDKVDSVQIASLVRAAGTGNREALDQVWPKLYRNLHEIASRQMKGESQNHLLQTTAVVHEAYFRLSQQQHSAWGDQNDFLAAAAITMRRILVDASRKRNSQKRGGGNTKRNDLSDTQLAVSDGRFEVLEIHEALRRLEEFSPQQSTALEMMIFGGATLPQIAAALSTSVSTVERRIRSARAWLRRELTENSSNESL